MSDLPTITLAAATGAIRVGDIITFAGRPKWWRRVLIWLRIMKKPEPQKFTVTWSSESTFNLDARKPD